MASNFSILFLIMKKKVVFEAADRAGVKTIDILPGEY
jgi:hypothetical protein